MKKNRPLVTALSPFYWIEGVSYRIGQELETVRMWLELVRKLLAFCYAYDVKFVGIGKLEVGYSVCEFCFGFVSFLLQVMENMIKEVVILFGSQRVCYSV